MSVASPVVDSWDGQNRRIYLRQGVVTFNWLDDIYPEYRAERRLTEDFRKWAPFMEASGNVPKGGGKATPRLLTLLEGVKVIPWDENVVIDVTGEAITDNADVDPTLFDTSTRTQPIVINYQPPSSEFVTVTVSSGSGLTPEQDAALNTILNILEGDMIPTADEWKILHKATKQVLVVKDATNVGGLTQLTEP